MAQRQRPSRSITLAEDLWNRLELEATHTNQSLSHVIEVHLRDYYLDSAAARLDRLEATLNDFRAGVLPLVAIVSKHLQEWEGATGAAGKSEKAAPRIATYEEMYGPITPAGKPPDLPPPAPALQPRKRWPWKS
jgi:predicted transcriptional regulator